ncbi:MAG: hypothetical protein KF819_33645 [Labilithrix sp.]|nr:hypothetical protein [Labilithrix sp.]
MRAIVASIAAMMVAACNRGPEITCKVNDQCFVCPNEKAKADCRKDPTSSRCKWAEPSHCK